MTLEPAIIINHKIKFTTVKEFATEFSNLLKTPCLIVETDDNSFYRDVPNDFEGWVVYSDIKISVVSI